MAFLDPILSNCSNTFSGLFKDEGPGKITNINQLDEETLELVNNINQVDNESSRKITNINQLDKETLELINNINQDDDKITNVSQLENDSITDKASEFLYKAFQFGGFFLDKISNLGKNPAVYYNVEKEPLTKVQEVSDNLFQEGKATVELATTAPFCGATVCMPLIPDPAAFVLTTPVEFGVLAYHSLSD